MATVSDVAAFILADRGLMTAMKLQKLAYYSQAWALVWDEQPIFEEDFEAWANGPVAPSLYRAHAGKFTVEKGSIEGDPAIIATDHRETILKVLEFYGDKSAQTLSDLTHSEPPWKDARGELPSGASSKVIISKAAMAEYYGSL